MSRGAFDLSPRALAERFGRVTLARLQAGQDPREAARLAFSYAGQMQNGLPSHDADDLARGHRQRSMTHSPTAPSHGVK